MWISKNQTNQPTKQKSRGTLAIKWLRRPLPRMSVSILLSHLCLCSVTHEESSPGDKDGISMSLAMLNSTLEAALAVDSVECPYPNSGDWCWVLWGDWPNTWWQTDCRTCLSLKNWATSCFYCKIHLLRRWMCFPCPQCFPPDYHDCCIHHHGFPHSFASGLDTAEFPF